MADRSIVVRLRAEVSGYKAAMEDAARATRKVPEETKRAETSLGRMVQSAQTNRAAWTAAGTSMVAFGALAVGAIGVAANEAIKWESAWTGVTKTVDGTAEQMAALEDDLRELARTLPATHEEIAAVAEAAGQLGIQRESVASFTKTMVDLAETTNLSADEAATSIAQMMNVMGTAPDEVDNLGAALVALGNAGASTERDIIQMAQRIAGAGKIVGLSEGQVMGLANALASTGIEVEAGGSAVSKIMIDISKAVSSNGEQLTTWASLAGMTAKDFAAAWNNDPADALATMIEGLGALSAAGGDVFGTLDTLGQSDIRVTRALLSMAGSGDLLRQSLELGTQAWQDNTALLVEAAKRYETTESKIAIAKNTIRDSAITIGEQMLPAISGLAEGVAGLAEWFGNLPEPLQGALTALTGITGAVSLVAGGFLLVAPRILDTAVALRTLRADGSKIPGVLGGVAKSAGAAAAAFAAFTAVTALVEGTADSTDRLRLSASRATEALLNMKTVQDLDTAFEGLGAGVDKVQGIEDALSRVTAPGLLDRVQDFGGSIRGIFGKGTTARTATLDQIDSLGQGLATLVSSGAVDQAASLFAQLQDAWVRSGGAADDLIGFMPAYQDALAEMSNEQDIAAGSAGLMSAAEEQARMAATRHTDAMQSATGAAQDQAQALQDLIDAQHTLAGVALSDEEAQIRFHQALADATTALEQNGRTLDITTDAGRANRSALLDIADASWAAVDAAKAHGASEDELVDKMDASRQAFVDAAVAAGMTTAEASALADELNLIPANVTTTFVVDDSQVQALLGLLSKPIYAHVAVGAGGAGGITRASGGILPGAPSSVDNMVIRAASGEFVVNARQTAKHRPLLEAINSGAPAYAAGGYVQPARYMSAPSYSPAAAPAPMSLVGLEISGTLDTPWGPSQMRGVVRQEMASAIRKAVR